MSLLSDDGVFALVGVDCGEPVDGRPDVREPGGPAHVLQLLDVLHQLQGESQEEDEDDDDRDGDEEEEGKDDADDDDEERRNQECSEESVDFEQKLGVD